MIIPTLKWDLIMRAVSISSYLPGRIRLHSKKLIGNAELGVHEEQLLRNEIYC